MEPPQPLLQLPTSSRTTPHRLNFTLGAPWVFMPQCGRDGFFSNMRQHIAMVAAFRGLATHMEALHSAHKLSSPRRLPFVIVAPTLIWGHYQRHGAFTDDAWVSMPFGAVFDVAHLRRYLSAQAVVEQTSFMTSSHAGCAPPRFVHVQIVDAREPWRFAPLSRCPAPCTRAQRALRKASLHCDHDRKDTWRERPAAMRAASNSSGGHSTASINVSAADGLAALVMASHAGGMAVGAAGCGGTRLFLDGPPSNDTNFEWSSLGARVADGTFGRRRHAGGVRDTARLNNSHLPHDLLHNLPHEESDWKMVDGAGGLRFAPLVHRAAAAVASRWGLRAAAMVSGGDSAGASYVAMHLRRGNTFAIRDGSGQVSTEEMLWAIATVREREVASGCVAQPTEHLVLSTVERNSTLEAASTLQRAHPYLRVHHFEEDGLWQDVARRVPEWDAVQAANGDGRRSALMRMLVEVQMWLDADVFVGTRSSMSEATYLMRAAQRGVRRMCQLSAQPCFYGTNCAMTKPWRDASISALEREQVLGTCRQDDEYYHHVSGKPGAGESSGRLSCTRKQPIPLGTIASSTPS